jgi:sarcosine oxidase
MRLSPGERCAFVPEAGWVDTDAAHQATLLLAERAGARLARERVGTLGGLASFDLVVVAAGGWACSLAGVKARPTLQTSAYVRGRYDGPVWIEGFGAELYGFPNAPGAEEFKVGCHAEGPPADMESAERPTDPGQLALLTELAARRFGLPPEAVGGAFACVYTRSEGGRFQIGWADRRTIVVSACSGHGYKFAPWVGRLVAGMAAGTMEPPKEFALQ